MAVLLAYIYQGFFKYMRKKDFLSECCRSGGAYIISSSFFLSVRIVGFMGQLCHVKVDSCVQLLMPTQVLS